MSRQAVGGRVGHNPISIIIPCHRVVGRNGSLTGYAGGIDKKISLLQHENADMSKLYRPAKALHHKNFKDKKHKIRLAQAAGQRSAPAAHLQLCWHLHSSM